MISASLWHMHSMNIWQKLWMSDSARAASLALVLLIFLGLVQPSKPEVGMAKGNRLLVADFINETADPDLGPELREILDLTLDHSKHFTLYSQAKIQESLRRLARDPNLPVTSDIALQICVREGIPAFLQPRVSRLGNEFVMSAQLVAVKDGTVREASVDMVQAKDKGGLLAAIDELGKRVRSTLGENRESLAVTSSPLPPYATASTEALQLFAKALAVYRMKDYEGQVSLLEQAVRLDPHFAVAQMRLASQYAHLGQTKKSLEHISLAKDDVENLPPKEKYGILGTYFFMKQRFPEAMQQWQSLAAIYPDDWKVHFELADTALLTGNIAKAVYEFQTAVRLDDSQADSHLGLCMAQLLNRYTDAARKAWDRASALEPENPKVVYTSGLIDLVENNLGSAVRAFQRVASSSPALIRSFGTLLLGQAQIYGGRFHSALETLSAGIEEDLRRGDMQSATDKWLALAQIHLLLGDQAAALSVCRQVPSVKGDAIRMGCLGTIYARLGHAAEAQELLKQIEQIPSTPLAQSQAEMLRGEVELAAGRTDDAVRSLSKAKELDAAGRPLEPLARALASAGRWGEAAREYEAIINQKAAMLFPSNRTWFMGTWVRALHDAGLCMQKLGRRSETQQYLRSYLWVLDGADPSLNSLQEAKALLRNK